MLCCGMGSSKQSWTAVMRPKLCWAVSSESWAVKSTNPVVSRVVGVGGQWDWAWGRQSSSHAEVIARLSPGRKCPASELPLDCLQEMLDKRATPNGGCLGRRLRVCRVWISPHPAAVRTTRWGVADPPQSPWPRKHCPVQLQLQNSRPCYYYSQPMWPSLQKVCFLSFHSDLYLNLLKTM